nr:phospholipase D family protein [Marinobacter sediminum]
MTALVGCALPPLAERPESEAVTPRQTVDTRLGRAIAPSVGEHPDLSGIIMLNNPYDAFAARALLAEAADTSLDIQYYIWRYDITGKILFHTLYRAAERGVRVRLLLDDNGISGLDEPLAALDSHTGIEVRLFNPFAIRSPKLLGYLTDFSRLNHRMHNKSFTADNQATIVGGRNIADEYFGAGHGALFADLDVLAIGPVVADVSRDFDRYWSSALAYPVWQLLPEADEADLAQLVEEVSQLDDHSAASRYVRAVRRSQFLQRLLDQELAFSWDPVTMVSDDPAKAQGKGVADGLLSRQLSLALGQPEKSVTLVSPYFIPTDSGLDLFRKLEQAGVEVRVLTNSLEANDVALVHAGYAKYRKPLLKAGVELFEMRKLAGEDSVEEDLQSGLTGSSSSSLHAKTFVVDGKTLFVGSFNFDPRSTHINTELGFIIESRRLATVMETRFDEEVPLAAYELVLDEDGGLQWIERNGDQIIRYDHDPGTGPLKRMLLFLYSLLPIESLL